MLSSCKAGIRPVTAAHYCNVERTRAIADRMKSSRCSAFLFRESIVPGSQGGSRCTLVRIPVQESSLQKPRTAGRYERLARDDQ